MAISTGPAPTNEWFQPGDTLIFGYTEVTTMTYDAGVSANVYIVTSKKIPSGMTLSGDITVLSAKKNGGSVETPIFYGATGSGNRIALDFRFSNSIGSNTFVRIAFSGTITFS